MPNKKIAVNLTKKQIETILTMARKLNVEISSRKTSFQGYNSWVQMHQFNEKIIEVHNVIWKVFDESFNNSKTNKNKKLDPYKIPHFKGGDNL